MPPPNSSSAGVSSSPKRKDISAELKLRLNMAFESMTKAAAAGTSTIFPLSPSLSLSTVGTVKTEFESIMKATAAAAGTSTIFPLSPSLSLSTVGTVKTEYFGEGELIEFRDEIHQVDAEMDSLREGVDAVVMQEIPQAQSSMSILTQKAAETNNYWPVISRSTSTTTSSLWDSLMSTNSKISANTMGYLSANTTTSTSGSGDFFSVGCPIAMSLSYSNSVEGLEILPSNTNTMLSMSNSLAYSESIGDTVTLVNDDHAKLGCLVAVKDLAIEVKGLADDISLVACDARDFYNSPRKSVTFTHFSPCGDNM
eukprot:scaffold13133_cov216-Skeletonema_marinoi.AAC.7